MKQELSVVTIGGGSGQSTLLAALRRLPYVRPAAIVTTFDSGGSSRVLKDQYGVLPYGDIQRCVFALSPYEHVRDIFSARLDMPELAPPYHTGGNLLLSALEQDFSRHMDTAQARRLAVRALERMFAAQGRVIPASLENANLCATFAGDFAGDEPRVDELLQRGRSIRDIFLRPEVPANPDALAAVSAADVIIVAPGSFYTSILPPLLPAGMPGAIAASAAPVLWVMNLLTEGEEMAVYRGLDFVRTLSRYAGRAPRHLLVNSEVHELPARYLGAECKRVLRPELFGRTDAYHVFKYPLWTDPATPRHDTDALASALGLILPAL
ncbi:MAG TPA: gluconeogenesis factor YvcK family protein [Candidatus Paceibacterota bacterium]|nr:gluconeogenesis factor YvcK family protein [Candidatus Paceibacterota bacterium]